MDWSITRGDHVVVQHRTGFSLRLARDAELQPGPETEIRFSFPRQPYGVVARLVPPAEPDRPDTRPLGPMLLVAMLGTTLASNRAAANSRPASGLSDKPETWSRDATRHGADHASAVRYKLREPVDGFDVEHALILGHGNPVTVAYVFIRWRAAAMPPPMIPSVVELIEARCTFVTAPRLVLRAVKSEDVYELSGAGTIGRQGTIAIDDPSMSQIHGRIEPRDGRWWFTGGGAPGSCLVGARPVKGGDTVEIRHGTVLLLGKTLLKAEIA